MSSAVQKRTCLAPALFCQSAVMLPQEESLLSTGPCGDLLVALFQPDQHFKSRLGEPWAWLTMKPSASGEGGLSREGRRLLMGEWRSSPGASRLGPRRMKDQHCTALTHGRLGLSPLRAAQGLQPHHPWCSRSRDEQFVTLTQHINETPAIRSGSSLENSM